MGLLPALIYYKKDNATREDDLTTKDSPPPSRFSGGTRLINKTITGKEIEDIQQLFNNP
jgi:hypothetical protein